MTYKPSSFRLLLGENVFPPRIATAGSVFLWHTSWVPLPTKVRLFLLFFWRCGGSLKPRRFSSAPMYKLAWLQGSASSAAWNWAIFSFFSWRPKEMSRVFMQGSELWSHIRRAEECRTPTCLGLSGGRRMILSLPTAKCHRRQAPGNTDKLETDSAEREREIEIERWRERLS